MGEGRGLLANTLPNPAVDFEEHAFVAHFGLRYEPHVLADYLVVALSRLIAIAFVVVLFLRHLVSRIFDYLCTFVVCCFAKIRPNLGSIFVEF